MAPAGGQIVAWRRASCEKGFGGKPCRLLPFLQWFWETDGRRCVVFENELNGVNARVNIGRVMEEEDSNALSRHHPTVLAVAFFVGAGVNAYLVLGVPEVYEGFADLSFLRFYRSLWRGLVLPRLRLWVALVIIFEVAAGVLLLSADPYATLGLVLAAAYTAFLFPFWWGGGGLVNIVLFLVMLWLLRFPYTESIPSLLSGG